MSQAGVVIAHKARGDQFYEEGKWQEAIESFNAALEIVRDPEDAATLLLDRCNARIKLHYYDLALKDASAVLSITPGHEAALFAIAQTLYKLRRFTECQHNLVKALKGRHGDEAVLKLNQQCRTRLEEERGVFDFASMLDEAIKLSPQLCSDRATFIGPIEMRTCSPASRGRGYFAMQDLKAGDLLLVDKAFLALSCFIKNTEQHDHGQMYGPPHIPELSKELRTETLKILRQNPSLVPKFSKLFPGPDVKEEIDERTGYPKLNKKFVNTRIAYNAFVADVPLKEWKWRTQSPVEAEVNHEDKGKSSYAIGCWIDASFFNHSCKGNVRRSFIGNSMIIRAQEDIAADQELVFSYLDPSEPVEERRSGTKHYGFECQCSICESESNTPTSLLQERKTLVNNVRDLLMEDREDGVSFSDCVRLLDEIQSTYLFSPHDEPRTAILDSTLALVQQAKDNGQHRALLFLTTTLLRAMGFEVSIDDGRWAIKRWGFMCAEVREALVTLWWACGQASPVLAADLERDSKVAYSIMHGESESFQGAYGRWDPATISRDEYSELDISTLADEIDSLSSMIHSARSTQLSTGEEK